MGPMNPRMNPPRGVAGMGPMGPGSYGPGAMRGPPPNNSLGPGPGGPGSGPGMSPMGMAGPSGGRPGWQPNTSTVSKNYVQLRVGIRHWQIYENLAVREEESSQWKPGGYIFIRNEKGTGHQLPHASPDYLFWQSGGTLPRGLAQC